MGHDSSGMIMLDLNIENMVHDLEAFSWEMHAMNLFSKFLPDVTELLNSLKNYTNSLGI